MVDLTKQLLIEVRQTAPRW